MTLFRTAVLWLAFLASGWAAGFFWTYSFSVMPGLALAPPEAAMASMQGINAAVRNPFFAFVFFGALALPLAAWAMDARGPAGRRALAAGLVYAAGVFAVTFLIHVPMNEALAGLDPVAAAWAGYAPGWTGWNHLRAAAATLAMLMMADALRFSAPRR